MPQQGNTEGQEAASRGEVLRKLISIRHYCFLRGVLLIWPDGTNDFEGYGKNGDFLQAFRTVNTLYVLARDAQPIASATRADDQRAAAAA